MEFEEFLEHHGIKGQKWGVRRRRGPGGTVSKSASPPLHDVSNDAARAKDIQTRISTGGTKTVSNQELQHLVTRMNLEKQYSTLTSQTSQSRLKTGASYAKKVLSAAKTANEVVSVVNSPAAKLLRQQLIKK